MLSSTLPDRPAGLLDTLLTISLTAVALLRPVYATDGTLTDFAWAYLNPAGQRMLQQPEVPAASLLALFPTALEDGVFAKCQQAFLTGEVQHNQTNYQADGLDGYFLLTAQRCEQLLVVNFTDTNDQPRTPVEQALRDSQDREQQARAEAERQRTELWRVFEQAPMAIAVYRGPRYLIELANATVARLWGRTQEQLLGKGLFEALPEVAGMGYEQLLDGVMATGEPHVARAMQAQHERNGRRETAYWDFVYVPMYAEANRINGVMVVAIEVTLQVLARRQLEQLNQELEARVQERTAQVREQGQVLERLFTQAPAGICILAGPDLVYEFVNPAYQQLLPGRALRGKPILEALPELVGTPVAALLRHVYDTGETREEQGLHIPVARPDGSGLEDRYFTLVYQPRRHEHGQIDGVLAFVFEVTEQVRARQASEAAAQRLRLLTDALPVLIGYLDRDRRYQFANEAYRAWFNQDPAALLGRAVREVVGEPAYAATSGYMDRALAGEQLDFEARMPYRPDFTKYIRTSFVPDVHQGQVLGFYTLVTDITEQVLARQQVQTLNKELAVLNEELQVSNEGLHRANTQLSHINADLDTFVYTASHDLKAPITNLEGLLQVLREETEAGTWNATANHALALMQDAIERFRATLGHLTEITRLQPEATPTAPVELATLIADVKLDLAPLLAGARAQVRVEVGGCPALRVPAKTVRSVVYNLLSNALKYRALERPLVVYIRCRLEGQHAVLEVEDNGLGLDLSKQTELFNMFRRYHTHVEGSGVGLYMVKRMAEQAGGHIEVVSQLGQGSTFRVYFRA